MTQFPAPTRYWVAVADQGQRRQSWSPVFRILYRFLSALARLAVRSGRTKDLEIIVLRHQLTVLRRQVERPAIDNNDRSLLGAIAAALPRRLRQGWFVTPETLLRWHRRRIARHWTQPSRHPGRRPTANNIRSLVIEMATRSPPGGTGASPVNSTGSATASEPQRCGESSNDTTRHDIDPAPNRSEVTWTQFLRSQAAVACDFATIDTAFLRRYYLLFFINVKTREVFYAGITAHPTGAWTTQAARNLFLRHRDQLDGAASTPLRALRVVRTTRCDGIINEYRNAA